MSTLRLVLVWLLPLIVIGGLFYPVLGFLVVGMMGVFLPLSFFKSRFWCWYVCPRGTFLDMVLMKVSANQPTPPLFTRKGFRWVMFVLLMGFLVFRMIQVGTHPLAVGSVFVGMCVLTTLLAILLGIVIKHRAWCMICPMGLLQENLGRAGEHLRTRGRAHS